MKKINVGSKLCVTGLSTALLMSTVGYSYLDVAQAKDQKDDSSKSKSQQQDNKSAHSSTPSDNDLKKAVEDAKKAGVNVKQGNIQHHRVTSKNVDDTQKQIQADYQKKIDELQKATKKYKEDKENYNKEVSAVKAYNDKQLKKYNDEVKKQKSTVDDGKKNPSKPKYEANINGDKGKYYTKSKSWHNLKSKTIDNDIHVNATGDVNSFKDLQNGNFAIHAYSDKKGKLSNDKIVQKVSWGDVKPQGDIVKGDKVTEDMHKKVPSVKKPAYDTTGKDNPFGKTTQLHSVKAGKWVTIPNAVHLANGKTKDLKVKFTKSGTNLDYGKDWVTFWNEGGSINYYDGTHDLSHTPPKDKITAHYKVGDGKDKYLWTGATFDIDGGQALTMEDNNYGIVALGGGLKVDSDKVKKVTSSKYLGDTWGKDKGSNLLNGTSSVPDGTAIFAKYDNVISHSVSNTGVKGSTLVANGDFGMHVNTSIAEYPKLKKEPKKPEPPKVQYNLQDMSINPTTKKSVSKKDVGYDKDYNYTLDYQLPVIKDNQESKKTKDEQNSSKKTNNENPKDEFNGKYENDYHTFTLGDDLPNELRIQKDKIKVTDDKGKDVTKEGDLKVDEKNQSFRWTPKKPSDFSEKKLKVTVASQVSSEADLKKWKKDNNTFEIPNTGYLELDGKKLPTNKVPVFVKKKVHSDIKKHILEDNKLKDHNKSKKGNDINYQLDYTIGNDKNYKKVALKDDLEDVEDLKGVKVYLPKKQKDELSKKELSDIQNALKGTDTKQDDIKPESSEDKSQKDSDEDKKGDDQNEKTNKDTAQDEKSKSNDQSQKSSQKSESKGSDSQSSEQVKDDDKSNDNSSKDDTADNSKSHNTSKGDSTSKDDKTTKDDSADDSKSEDTTKDDNKDDSSSDATTKDDSSKATDDSKTDDAQSDDAQSSDAKPENGDLDITKLGDLNVDNEKESFEWTPKESKLLKGKKVKVLLTSKFKKDVDYKNFAKGEKYIVPNTSQIKYDDKTENSNKVDTEIPKPKKPENVVPPKKEEPKKPAPKPQQPAPQPKKEQPKKETPKKDLPMTGTEKSVAGVIIGAVLIGLAGVSTYLYRRKRS
ncbi:LPXTG cell wall anchor domain-containing protein [Staphylococcus capitis]|uniref:LPXTG cell wall anchor domain-containing protein n=3 Tax=Staphylococcus TaxID=1279 RepID=UPI0037D3A65D